MNHDNQFPKKDWGREDLPEGSTSSPYDDDPYAECAKELGISNPSSVHEPIIEACYIQMHCFEYDSNGELIRPSAVEILRRIAPRFERIQKKCGEWERKTQPGLKATQRRGEVSRQSVIKAATEYASKRSINWRHGEQGAAPAKVVNAVVNQTGLSGSQVRRYLNRTK